MSDLYEFLFVIVKCGLGSKVTRLAKQIGAKGTTTFLGHGTGGSRLMKFLELTDIRREIVMVLIESGIKEKMIQTISDEFSIEKANQGIIFSIPVKGILGASTCAICNNKIGDEKFNSDGGKMNMHNAILVIVDKGNAEEVIESANAAGARGGTIINARGSGIHETAKLFSMEIEPEKEVVLIVTNTEITSKIAQAIRKDIDLDCHGKGIMVILPVDDAIGLH